MKSKSTYLEQAELVVNAVKYLASLGINGPTSGNISLRINSGFLITPSGIDYKYLRPEKMVILGNTGVNKIPVGIKPSSEWRIHKDIYDVRPEVCAIVHTHSEKATALSCLRREIPSFHYMVALAGGYNIRCAPYATFGTQRLSDLTIEALEDRYACLLSNHGTLALGLTLPNAVNMAIEVESLAAQYLSALSISEPELLSKKEMINIVERFKLYKDIKDLPDIG
jgi:L-fuculose-phosphate aldolase